jgi:flagellar secretion chaperone FliS
MRFSNPWQSYRQVAAQTAPPGQLILMLYDGAIRFLHRAQTGFSKDDPSEANTLINNNILRAQQIIRELNLCLNMDLGGELAVQLRRLYDYFDWRLQQSNAKKEPNGVLEVINRISVLRDAWATMLEGEAKAASPEDAPAARVAA